MSIFKKLSPIAALFTIAVVSSSVLGQDKAAPKPATATISSVDLVKCGVYESSGEKREPDPKAKSGHRVILNEDKLVKVTSRVPARVGTRFGCGIRLHGSPKGEPAEFRAVMRVRGSGGQSKEFSGSQKYAIGGDQGHVGYTFRSEASVMPGEWKMEIWAADRKMAETTFTVAKD